MTTAKTMFHAVVNSCWETEYAVASVGLAIPFSEATLNACVTPAPPGVTEVTFATELPPVTCMTVWKLTGIEYAARKTAVRQRLAIQPASEGANTRAKYAAGWARILPPSFACSHQLRTRGQIRRTSR